MERSGELLTRVAKVFFNLSQSNTSDAMQKIKAEEAPKLAAHQDAIYLNAKLFARVKALYDRRDALGLDPEARYLVERYYLNFVRAGAQLSEADKTTLRALNQEESKLTTQFTDKVLADTNASAVVVDDRAELAGLSEGDIAAAAEAAKERGLAGKWVLTLQNTTQQPALSSLKNRALRERLFQASVLRGNHGGANDTKAIVTRLAQLRAQRAKLLGFPNYAAFVLDDQMAKTPQNAEKLMTDLVPAATAKARDEAARMQKLIDAQKGASDSAPPTGSSTPRRSARPSTTSTSRRSGRTSSSSASCTTASSSPRTSSTASPSRSARTFPSISRTCASSRCSTPTASRWRSTTATTSHDRTRAAAPGRTASSTRAVCSEPSRSSSTSLNFTKPAPRASRP